MSDDIAARLQASAARNTKPVEAGTLTYLDETVTYTSRTLYDNTVLAIPNSDPNIHGGAIMSYNGSVAEIQNAWRRRVQHRADNKWRATAYKVLSFHVDSDDLRPHGADVFDARVKQGKLCVYGKGYWGSQIFHKLDLEEGIPLRDAVHEALSCLTVCKSERLSWGPTRTRVLTGHTPELQAAMERIKAGYDRKKLQPDNTAMFLALPPSAFIEAAKQDHPYHAFVERLLQSNASENLES